MKVVFTCALYNVALEGEPTWYHDGLETKPVEEDLPTVALSSVQVPQRMWQPDTSEMHCPNWVATDCQTTWQLHMFDDDGRWLAVA